MTSEDGLDVLKIIINYVAKTSSNQSELRIINEQRFKDVERLYKYKQIRISENTLWKSRNGNFIPIKEIVETYK